MFGVFVELIGALRVISAGVEFGLAGVVECAVDAAVIGGRGGAGEAKKHCDYE